MTMLVYTFTQNHRKTKHTNTAKIQQRSKSNNVTVIDILH